MEVNILLFGHPRVSAPPEGILPAGDARCTKCGESLTITVDKRYSITGYFVTTTGVYASCKCRPVLVAEEEKG